MKWGALLVLCACGRLGFDARPSDTSDGRTDDGDGDSLGGDAAVPLTCNFAARLYDDFEDGVFSDAVWGHSYTNPGTSIGEAGGDLVLTPASSTAGVFVGLTSSRFYNMLGQRHVVEVTQIASGAAVSGIQINPDTGDYVAIVHEGGQLKAVNRSGTYQVVDQITYVSAQHRYWSLREEGGLVHFETSPDAVTFNDFATLPAPFDMSLLRLAAYSGTSTAVASPGAMHVASLGRPALPGTACSADTLVDTFDTEDDVLWRNAYTGTGQTQTRTGGVLEMTSDGGTMSVSARSSAYYDLRGAAFTVELVTNPSAANMVAALAARVDDNNLITLAVTSTQTFARYEVGGSTTSDTMTRNPAEKWLRIREQSGSYFIEVSVDRSSWRLLRTGTTTFPVDDIGAVLRFESSSPTTADSVQWDNFNAP